jgi:hypothetical protein
VQQEKTVFLIYSDGDDCYTTSNKEHRMTTVAVKVLSGFQCKGLKDKLPEHVCVFCTGWDSIVALMLPKSEPAVLKQFPRVSVMLPCSTNLA